MDAQDIVDEMEHARRDFHHLLDTATSAELRRGSNGTRWTNEQLLFHMLFGYVLVRVLVLLVKAFSRAPDAVSRGFSGALNTVTPQFHVVNYLSSLGGARVLGHTGMERLLDHTVARLQAGAGRDADTWTSRRMHFPVGWDPYFTDVMTVRDVYHFASQHYDHHRRQLTLASTTVPPDRQRAAPRSNSRPSASSDPGMIR
jgi:hypothetical protein